MQSFAHQPIAVIGIAAALPGSGDDLALLSGHLEQGRDLVAPVPAARRRDGGVGPDTALSECALVDRIDAFDPRFFGMSMREARQMDPQQRMLLQLACKAIWDAGYALDQLRGSRTAVLFGAASESYSGLLAQDEAPLVTGLLPAAQAGRVAYELDLRGPAYTVDTACSSGLAAILEAARLVAGGEAELALTGAVRLLSKPPLSVVPGNEGILSPTGRARSFDAAADGTALGEGGVVYLLKPLAKAQQDGDAIHAVILGGARNQDGGRSNGFAAPSAEAQEELLVEAWRAAGINPVSLGLIEAHGTGTRLGDPIEFKALSAAFARGTDRTGFCVLSSIKSNIGHLDCAAGAAGLLKAVLALKNGRRYASAHFRTANPMLDTARSALLLSDAAEPWQTAAPRRAGVSAFGLTGTNVHVVLEQAPPQLQARPSKRVNPVLVPLAARSEAALRRHAARLAAHLDGAHGAALADVAWVQTAGRDHGPWRAAVMAVHPDEAVAALRALADGTAPCVQTGAAAAIVLLPHEGEADAAAVDTCLTLLPALRDWFVQEQKGIGALPPALHGHATALLHKLVLVRALIEIGVPDRNLIGHGSGNLLLDVLRGQADLGAAAAAAAGLGALPAPDPARLAGAFDAIGVQGEPVYLAPWAGQLATAAAQVEPARRGVALAAAGTDVRRALLTALAALYRCGAAFDWRRLAPFASGDGRRSHVPSDLFEPLRCWPEQSVPAVAPAAAPAPVAPAVPAVPVAPVAPVAHVAPAAAAADDAERTLAAIWRRLLEVDTIAATDDFFDLGGDSLMQTQLANAVKQAFGIDLDFNTVYDHPTLGALAAHIAAQAPVTAPAPAPASAPATPERRLAGIWQRLLEVDTIAATDDFFDLGGDSLMQTQLANAVKQEFGIDLDFNTVYDHPTLGALAAFLATQAPAPAAAAAAAPVPALTPEERALADIWRGLLQVDTIGRNDDFFALGGNLTLQTRLAAAVRQTFGVPLDFMTVHDYPTLAELAAHLAALTPAPVPAQLDADAPRHEPGRTRAPATHSQRRMWLLQQLDPASGAYNVSAAYALDGTPDADALRTGLARLGARHDILRAAFRLEEGELAMLVQSDAVVDVEVASVAAAGAEAALLRHAARPFDLAAPGAWRVLLLRDPDASRSWLQLVLHHAICDEWSLGLLLRELTAEYDAVLAGRPSPLAPPALQFGDWAAWEHGLAHTDTHRLDAGHWERVLAGAPTSLALPTDFPYGARQDYEGAWLPLALPADRVARMRAAARAANGSLFAWLLTGYAAWLARTTQTDDFLVGVPTAGRHHPAAEALPGCFINTLPVRIDASGDPSFRTLFGRVRDALAAALAHQRYPFDLMVEQLGAERDAARPPLVQTLLSLQGGGPGAGAALKLGDAALRPLQVAGAVAWFDLSAVLWNAADGALEGIFAYRSALFERDTIASFWRDWSALLDAGLSQPDEPIHNLLHDLVW